MDMTPRELLERRILLQQQAITQFDPDNEHESVERCRERIRANRRQLWEIADAADKNLTS